MSTKTEKEDNKGSKTFIASNIKNFIDHKKTLTSDHTILTAVSGYKTDFFIRPTQFRVPTPVRCFIYGGLQYYFTDYKMFSKRELLLRAHMSMVNMSQLFFLERRKMEHSE